MGVPLYLTHENEVLKPSQLFKSVFNFTFGLHFSRKLVQIFLVIGQLCLFNHIPCTKFFARCDRYEN